MNKKCKFTDCKARAVKQRRNFPFGRKSGGRTTIRCDKCGRMQ